MIVSVGVMHMPTKTFFNLSEPKRKRIFSAAVEEFASRRFSEASINQIVKEAGISRGSFYQYFTGKEDLYLYVLTEIGKEKISAAVPHQVSDNEDFFTAYLAMIKDILAWARERPLYTKIWMLMEFDDSEFIAKLTAQFPNAWGRLRELIERDKKLGRIRPDVNSDMVIQILYNLNLHFQKAIIRRGNLDDLLPQVEELVKILRGGIAIV
ncbi:MAG TPA: TetR/AcrR family transcriptional regulator [Bacillota bacterium]|nr:TetR/AcrR family transcriptional regulator [Bacillota bacterium]